MNQSKPPPPRSFVLLRPVGVDFPLPPPPFTLETPGMKKGEVVQQAGVTEAEGGRKT